MKVNVSLLIGLIVCSIAVGQPTSRKNNLLTKKTESASFSFCNIIFYHLPKVVSQLQNKSRNFPDGYIAVTSTARMKFDVNFQKNYFGYNNSIPADSLHSNTFYHSIFRLYYASLYKCDTANDPFVKSVSHSKFKFSVKNISGYGKCSVGIVATSWNNSNQDKCMVLINNVRHELSFWSYDEIQFDKEGNIIAMFRLKQNRAWHYYSYDVQNKIFVLVASRNLTSKN